MNSSRTKTTIVLADDNHAMLAEVSRYLQPHFDLVAAVSDGAQALQSVVDLQPQIVILDITMPIMNGMEAARAIKRLRLPTRIIFLSIQQDHDYVDAAITMGASYVYKPRMKSDLLPAIEEALQGGAFISETLNPQLVRKHARDSRRAE